MTEPSVDRLREQLRDLGYLSHGIDRWFEKDPWRSTAFWTELLIVSAKNALLLFAFLAAPLTAITSYRNRPIPLVEGVTLFGLYALAAFLCVAVLTLVIAAALKLRARVVIDRPGVLTFLSSAASGAVVLGVGLWWRGFATPPDTVELALGVSLLILFFAIATISFSAALLSLSIAAAGRIPEVRQQSRTRMILASATLLVIALLAAAALQRSREVAQAPQQVVTTPRGGKLALVAVDGLTYELASARRDLLPLLGHSYRAPAPPVASPPELWASVGTGVPPFVHGVHAVEGVRLPGGDRVLQAVSERDFILRSAAPALGAASREPLPPTARNRAYVWESIGTRGVPAAAVNWWASDDGESALLRVVSQRSIFGRAARGARDRETLATEVERAASAEGVAAAERQARFVTIYLPALDVLLNRLDLDTATSLAHSAPAFDNLAALLRQLRSRGYDLVVIGTPGRGQSGSAIIGSTIELARAPHVGDIAPTVLDYFGFPASDEMTGTSLLGGSTQQRIATYGGVSTATSSAPANNEQYYENLRSLGYIQ